MAKRSNQSRTTRNRRTSTRASVSNPPSKRRAKKAGKALKMPSSRTQNRSKATSRRAGSARTVAATTRGRGKGGDEEE